MKEFFFFHLLRKKMKNIYQFPLGSSQQLSLLVCLGSPALVTGSPQPTWGRITMFSIQSNKLNLTHPMQRTDKIKPLFWILKQVDQNSYSVNTVTKNAFPADFNIVRPLTLLSGQWILAWMTTLSRGVRRISGMGNVSMLSSCFCGKRW